MPEERLSDAAPPVAAMSALREAEVLPAYEVEAVDIDYAKMLQVFRERAAFVEGVVKLALSKTEPHHWIGRTQRDGTVQYDLMGPGAERIKSFTPIGFQNVRRWEEKWTRGNLPGYTIYYQAEVYLGSPKTGPLPVVGSCSSDDDFFSTEHVKLKYNPENPEHQAALESGEGRLSQDRTTIYITRRIPANEVTKENIEKAALTNLIVNGVTRVLGIRRMSAERLKEAGIDVSKLMSVDYGSVRRESGKLAPALEQKREELWRWLLEMAGGDEKKAGEELQRRTAFSDFAGFTDPKRLTEKQINMHYERIKQDYARFRGEAPAPQKPSGQQGRKGGGQKPEQPELL